MKKKKDGAETTRIKPELSKRINELLNKNDNRLYCKGTSNFVDVAVIQLLEDIEEKRGNKIRWGKNE